MKKPTLVVVIHNEFINETLSLLNKKRLIKFSSRNFYCTYNT